MDLDKPHRVLVHKNVFLFFLTLFFWADTFNSARTTFSYYDRFAISAITLTFLFIQILFLRALDSKVRNGLVTNIAFGCIITFNAFSLSLAQMEKFIQGSLFFKTFMILVVVFITSSLLNMMDAIKRTRLLILSLILLPLAATSIRPILPEITKLWIQPTSISSLENFKPVEFQRKPNVYIQFFDGLTPQSLSKKYMGLEKAQYHDVLSEKFYPFKNFFVNGVPSMNSINMFLALYKKYYDDLSDERIELFGGLAFKTHRKAELFQGNTESPLLKIFQQNGYETNTVFNTGFFGVKKGPYVDNYLVQQKFSACNYVHQTTKRITFFGYCNLSTDPSINKLLNTQPMIDFITDNFRKGLSKSKPQVFVSYIRTPGHTPLDYDHKKANALESYFTTRFKRTSKEATSNLKKIVEFVEKEDPSGLLYVLGDHGPWLSRQVAYKDDKEFFVQDRYGVYGGFFPPNKCQESFAKPYSRGYVTATQGIHMIIRCLSGGKNAFTELEDYSHLEKSYSNYLYE